MNSIVSLIILILYYNAANCASVEPEPSHIVFRNDTQITFLSSNITAEKVSISKNAWSTSSISQPTYIESFVLNKKNHLVQLRDEYKTVNASDILQSTYFPISHRTQYSIGFVHTIIDCYRNHHNLVVRPDDIWTAIMVQFSYYVNANAETLRDKFVNFDGKKELIVTLNHGVYDSSYDQFVSQMSKQIHENLANGEVTGWVLPNFSTTTPDDVITNSVILMSTLQPYFEFTAGIACGIPEITLLGTVDDWKNIAARIEKLGDYGLAKWADLLRRVLKQFVAAKSGNIEKDFWEDICRVERGGYDGAFLNGWITVFNVFNMKGRWRGDVYKHEGGGEWPIIQLDKLTSGVATVPVKIDNNGEIIRSTMFAGHMGQTVLENDVSIQPLAGWAIALSD